jgi:hypothetical protein
MRRGAAVALVAASAMAGAGAAALRAARDGGETADAPVLAQSPPMNENFCCQGRPPYPADNADPRAGAGPRATPYRAGGRQADRELEKLAPVPRLFHTGFGGWEPTLGLTRDGTILYGARNSNVDPVPLRSDDAGRTWKAILPMLAPGKRAHEVSVDPFVWVDPATERFFTTDLGEPLGCPLISWSDDRGATWSTSRVCGAIDHQNLFGGPSPPGGPKTDGYPNLLYYCTNDQDRSNCRRSVDGGRTWELPGEPAYSTADDPEGHADCGDWLLGHGVVDLHGTVYLPKGWCGRPFVSISRDGGVSWQPVRVADTGTNGHESAVAADETGHLFYAYADEQWRVRLVTSSDGGRTWSRPLDIQPPDVARATTIALAASAEGGVALAFFGTRQPAGGDESTAQWDVHTIQSRDPLAADPTFFATTVNDPAGNPFWRGLCESQRCGNMGDFLDVQMGPGGDAWVAAVDSCLQPGSCTQFGVTNPRGEAVLAQLGAPARLEPTPATPPVPACDRPAAAIRHARWSRRRLTIVGTATCSGDLRRVQVSVARRSGRRCRLLDQDGRLGRRARCNRDRWLSADGVGTWLVRFRRPLPAGTYVIRARVVHRDGRRSDVQARRRVPSPRARLS